MKPDLPYWFKQRQAKAEELGQAVFKISGPNLPEGVVSIRLHDNLKWQGILRTKADAPELATTPAVYPTPREALGAAFELYRSHMITG